MTYTIMTLMKIIGKKPNNCIPSRDLANINPYISSAKHRGKWIYKQVLIFLFLSNWCIFSDFF